MKKLIIAAAVAATLVACQKTADVAVQPIVPQVSKAPPAPTSTPAPALAADSPIAIEVPKAPTAWQGPFGVKMGITQADLGKVINLESGGPGFAVSKQAPNPHDDIETYAYYFSKSAGLCRVLGITPPIETNSFGEQAQNRFSALKNALTEKYKTPTVFIDSVRNGSIWTQEKEWMMSLKLQERVLTASWFSHDADGTLGSGTTNQAELPAELSGITLETQADSTREARITLVYTFKNFTKCSDEAAKNKSKSL